jgi:hypothetical protein
MLCFKRVSDLHPILDIRKTKHSLALFFSDTSNASSETAFSQGILAEVKAIGGGLSSQTLLIEAFRCEHVITANGHSCE